jgi:hypothetical protein
MLIIKIRIKFNSHPNKFEKQKNKITKIKLSSIRNVTKMQTHLISQDLDNLLFLDMINEDFREQSKLISILISSITQQSPLFKIYEEKKKLLLENLNSQRLNEKNLFRDKLVSVFNILNV